MGLKAHFKDDARSALSVYLFFSNFNFLSFLSVCISPLFSSACLQVSEVEVNGQIEAVCESVFSEMESQAVDALDLPMPGCFRMRSHSYVRAIDQGCSQDDEGPLLPASPPRTTTTVRTIQSSTGQPASTYSVCLSLCLSIILIVCLISLFIIKHVPQFSNSRLHFMTITL